MSNRAIIEQYQSILAHPELTSRVELVPGEGGLPCLQIATRICRGEIYLHGAHITRWQPAGSEPVLFMSAASRFEAGHPIRGGVPIIFPWFGPNEDDASLPAHGFARDRSWRLDDVRADDEGVSVDLSLEADDATRALWPFAFELGFTVTFGETLTMALRVANTNDKPFACEEALHTYFTVGDIKQVGVEGLAGVTYIDKMDNLTRKTEGEAPIRFNAETDRVYIGTDGTCMIDDPAMGRRIAIEKSGARSTVVWNPWIDKSARMADFGDDEWPGMVCIESANAADDRITIEPGEMHEMSVRIGVE